MIGTKPFWAVASLSILATAQDTLGVAKGYTTFSTAHFDLKLVTQSQTLASIKPAGSTFDFSPFDYISKRSRDGQYQLGDLTIRYRRANTTGAWVSGDSAQRRTAINPMKISNALAAADISPTLPAVDGSQLNITRKWTDLDGDLSLIFTLTNKGTSPLEIGALGFPLSFNNIFTGRTAEQTRALCSLYDPYIGLDAGYVQVTPLSGTGPALVVTPLQNSGFEAWRNLNETRYEDTLFGTQTFEGVYEWQTASTAYAENEWRSVSPWNSPTSKILQAGQTAEFGLRFSLAKEGPEGVSAAVRRTGTPEVIGYPGFVVPRDYAARLVVASDAGVMAMETEPKNAFEKITMESAGVYVLTPAADAWGRVRLTIRYADKRVQTVHYYITKSGPEVLSDAGNFALTKQWFTDTSDPFGRAPSILSWDHDANAFVTQENRVWIAGLSDEAGAGSFLVAALKQFAQPDAEQVNKLEQFLSKTVRTVLQTDNYSVRKSIFYYDTSTKFKYAPQFNWTVWSAWTKSQAYQIDRAYDYIHPAVAYWAIYRVGRAYPDLLKLNTADWYLDQAVKTIARMMGTDGSQQVGYALVGLMEETFIGEMLKDLYREGRTSQAKTLENSMLTRAKEWDKRAVPYGSEMAWDSTGQEGVYYWSKYFNLTSTRLKTVSSVLAYMPSVPHWGWNGNARRYWDNKYGGKIARIERQLHHYGSGLNALPLLSEFRLRSSSPSTSPYSSSSLTYLLRTAFAGNLAPLSNIAQDGFGSASFHSFPDTLRWEPYSGDYGPGFVGMVLGCGTYLSGIDDNSLGPLVFGGLIITNSTQSAYSSNQGTLAILPKDPMRRKVFVAGLGATVELEAGVIQQIGWNKPRGELTILLGQLPNGPIAKNVVLWVDEEKDSIGGGGFAVSVQGQASSSKSRGGWVVPIIATSTEGVTVVVTRIAGK